MHGDDNYIIRSDFYLRRRTRVLAAQVSPIEPRGPTVIKHSPGSTDTDDLSRYILKRKIWHDVSSTIACN